MTHMITTLIYAAMLCATVHSLESYNLTTDIGFPVHACSDAGMYWVSISECKPIVKPAGMSIQAVGLGTVDSVLSIAANIKDIFMSGSPNPPDTNRICTTCARSGGISEVHMMFWAVTTRYVSKIFYPGQRAGMYTNCKSTGQWSDNSLRYLEFKFMPRKEFHWLANNCGPNAGSKPWGTNFFIGSEWIFAKSNNSPGVTGALSRQPDGSQTYSAWGTDYAVHVFIEPTIYDCKFPQNDNDYRNQQLMGEMAGCLWNKFRLELHNSGFDGPQ